MGNFLHDAGTNGLFSTKRTVTWATSLNALGSGSRAISDTTADTGKFTQSSFSNAIWGQAVISHITNTWATTVGGAMACWWLYSTDGGSTYEAESTTTPSTTVPALNRPPDFFIPVYSGGTAIPAGSLLFSPPFRLPWLTCKLVVQNYSGVAMSAHAHTLDIFGLADKYA